MGYYTRYSLKVLKSPTQHADNEEEVIADLRKDEYVEACINEAGDCQDERKWYDHDDTMKVFSKNYPNLIFELEGEGEESGDMWKKYYKDGKSQTCQAVITFEEFNPLKLT